MMLAVRDLALHRNGRPILKAVSHRFAACEITILAGPNGAGKSTLLAALAGDLRPSAGSVTLDGRPADAIPLAQRARLRAVLPQRASVAFAYPVETVVAMGLHPHGIGAKTGTGAAHVARAIAALEIAHLCGRPVPDLSGGEAQRVHLARVLVQVEATLAAGRAPLLLLDEPATGLDWRHQFALARLLRQLAARGATIVLSLHDLALARALQGDALILAEGRLQAAGPVAEILSPALLARWFGLAAHEAALLAA